MSDTKNNYFIDTHCHLNLIVKQQTGQQLFDDTPLSPEQLSAVQTIVHEAAIENVSTILTVGTTLSESRNSIAIAQKYAHVWSVVGLHPNDCGADWRTSYKAIQQLVKQQKHNKIVGIGETGLDYYWPNYNKQRQRDAFKAHIELALLHNIALVIHLRPAKTELIEGIPVPTPDSAQDELFELLNPYKGQLTRGVMHCFCHDQTCIEQTRALGFVFGIGGVITYPKNEGLRRLVSAIPLEEIVLETDAPFLPPQIARGKQNHPKYIATIAHFLAQLKGKSVTEVAATTTRTAQRIFGLPHS